MLGVIWQWRSRYYPSKWEMCGDGSEPDIWWLQREYRVVSLIGFKED